MKKLFIWHFVAELTGSYHSGGGLVVVAEDLLSAREAILKDGVPAGCSALAAEPDITANTDAEVGVFIFPDAGCC